MARAAGRRGTGSGPLAGRVALVAGATRGAGRGIAASLGEAGAIVYCSGRSTREHPATGVYAGMPETIEETAELVTAKGGLGIAVRTDHLDAGQVSALVARIEREQGRLDILVNDISEGAMHDWTPFWKVDVERGFDMFRNGVHTHIITSRLALPLMLTRRGKTPGLIVEVTDGWGLGYRGTFFYDMIKMNVNRLAHALGEELFAKGIAAVAITPGYMRTEMVLKHHGVTERNWQTAVKKDKLFAESETPFFVGRAVAALAADPEIMKKTGGLYSSWRLAEEYGFNDIDGRTPHLERRWAQLYGENNSPMGSAKLPITWSIAPAPQPKPPEPELA
ncbi:MAG TPA: SDR family oxidoreductase [Vicinamibacterales bacterium]|nr:SDR family oxidoreductase [Vicinamibacterales bacterium]